MLLHFLLFSAGSGCSLKFGPSLLKTFGRLLESSEAEISRL
jgi:hypothetical protein